jgi:redox-sensing transcriptional repressor
MRYHKIPDETVRRLPLYLRGLLFASAQKRKKISSRNLEELVGVNSWQIRKDFSYFGDFGTRGVGYDINKLAAQIRKILKIAAVQKAALVGVGNIGSAVLAYSGFSKYNLDIAVAFDISPKKIGRKIENVVIEDITSLGKLKQQKIKLGIIAVPERAAQETADKLVKAGIKGILNFSPCYIEVPKKVKVITVDIATHLASLPYYMPAI